MNIFSAIASLAASILGKVLPDKVKQQDIDFELMKQKFAKELQEALIKSNLLTKQMDINLEEAKNPNRTWITWRELVGYGGAVAVWYNYIIQPFVVMFSNLIGYPLDQNVLVQLNIGDLLSLLFGMLGLAYTPSAVGFVANKISNRNKN